MSQDKDRKYCIEYEDGNVVCYRDNGFWYSDKGVIFKWILLSSIFLFFFAWFFGGYIHAKRRMKKGQPLLSYHRFLVSYADRARYGQAGIPQNNAAFYQSQRPYAPYQQRQDGAWTDPPPMYNNNDAPPQYFPPQGATKVSGNQAGTAGMEMPQYGQQSGVAGNSGQNGRTDVEAQNAELPPRPPTAKAKILGALERFRR